MSPKVSEAHLKARRQQILDAAVACFSDAGLHHATLEDIRQRAGLSRGAVYHYFRSKDDIIAALRDRSTAEYVADRSRETATDAHGRLLEFTDVAIGRMRDPRQLEADRVGVALWAEALHSGRIREQQIEVMGVARSTLAEIVRQGQAEDVLPAELDPEATAVAIVGAYLGLQLQYVWQPELDVDAASRALRAMLSGLFAPPS